LRNNIGVIRSHQLASRRIESKRIRVAGFAQLIKGLQAASEREGRYSPVEVASSEVVPITEHLIQNEFVRRLWNAPISVLA
jgi:hypothetical protein